MTCRRQQPSTDVMLTQVHRQEADSDLHAATLEDQFLGKGWAPA